MVNFAGHRTIWGRFNGECVDLNFENVLCHIVPLSGQFNLDWELGRVKPQLVPKLGRLVAMFQQIWN